MKRSFWIFLLIICLLCSALAGCQKTNSSSQGSTQSSPLATTLTEGDLHIGITPGRDDLPTVPDGMEIYGTDKLRITYTINLSSVRYVTSTSMLPKYEALAQYDDAYFQTNALILVTETVSSGSVDVGISSIEVNGTQAIVTLYHEATGSASTADMATWLIWAEVDQGLDYQWTVANPAFESSAATS